MPHRWQLDSHVVSRSLGEQAVAFHSGSGDTHLLTPFSEALLEVLAECGTDASLSPAELLDDPRIAGLQLSGQDVEDALSMLEEAGLVHGVTHG